MPKKVKLVNHLNCEELKEKYLKSLDPIESRRWHLLWKISQSWSIKNSAIAVGISYDYAREIVRKYNSQGTLAVINKKKTIKRKGRPSLLNPEQLEQLGKELLERPSDGGIWTGPKVARWMETKTGKTKIGNQRGWDYLKKSNYSWKIPRRKHYQSDIEEQKQFQNQLPEKIVALQQKYPQAQIELWFMDEESVGLKPIIRRTWTPIGSQPLAIVQERYEWLYIYSFVHPSSGRTHWYLIPRVNIDWFNLALTHFAQEADIGAHRKSLLVSDRAGWHRSEKVKLPDGIVLEFLPPYSPELQPAERLWKLVDEPLVNEHFKSLNQLEDVLAKRCCTLTEMTKQIHHLTAYHWLPNA